MSGRYDSRERDQGGNDNKNGSRADGKRIKGYVVSWHDEKGFGFIKPFDGGEDVFTHVSCLKDGDCLDQGKEVMFENTFDSVKGKYRAVDVTGCGMRRNMYPNRGGGDGGRRRDDSRRRDSRRRGRSRDRKRDSRSRSRGRR